MSLLRAGTALLILVGCSSPEPMASGVVTLVERTGGSIALEAAFGPTPLEEWASTLGPAACTVKAEAGACVHIECDPSFRSDDAGVIEWALDDAALPGVMLGSGVQYSAPGLTGDIAEETVARVEASGGIVPAFSAEITAPAEPEVTLPFAIEPGEPVELTWEPSSADRLIVRAEPMRAPPPGTPTTFVACDVDPMAGALTIDGTVTAGFEPPESGYRLDVILDVAFVNEETIEVEGTYEVVVRVGHRRTEVLRSNP